MKNYSKEGLIYWVNTDLHENRKIITFYKTNFSYHTFFSEPSLEKNRLVKLYSIYDWELYEISEFAHNLKNLYENSDCSTLEQVIYNFFILFPIHTKNIDFDKTNEINDIFTQQEIQHLKFLQKVGKI